LLFKHNNEHYYPVVFRTLVLLDMLLEHSLTRLF